MEQLLRKLNYKGTSEILISNAPIELTLIIEAISSETVCIQDVNQLLQIEFALFFVLDQKSIDDIVPKIVSRLIGDCTIWFCYPKKSSVKYRCNIDRDHGWQILGLYGFEPVRQVAINEDFSAIRFRKVEYIKNITRSSDMALTEEAKKRLYHMTDIAVVHVWRHCQDASDPFHLFLCTKS